MKNFDVMTFVDEHFDDNQDVSIGCHIEYLNLQKAVVQNGFLFFNGEPKPWTPSREYNLLKKEQKRLLNAQNERTKPREPVLSSLVVNVIISNHK